MNQHRDLGAFRFDGLAGLRVSHRVASMQKQLHISAGEFFCDRATNSAARARSENVSCSSEENVERRPLNVQRRIQKWCRRRAAASGQRTVPSNASSSPQCKPVIGRFPQTQSHHSSIKTIINLWPKRADDIFPCRRRASKIVRFQIEMPILPRL